MKESKKEKKARKEEKNTRVLVKEAFNAEKTKGKTNPLVENLVKSVLLNKALLRRDKKALKDWQDSYYQDLFTEFKRLVDRHNEIYQTKIDSLIIKIGNKKNELKTLKAEVKKLEAEKELLCTKE